MSTAPATEVLHVRGMTCQHCVRAVTQAIQALDATADVQIDLPSGTVRVVSTLPRPALRQAVECEGYEVEPQA